MTKTLTWAAGTAAPPLAAVLLHLLAAALRAASAGLARVAAMLDAAEGERHLAGTVEFHALHREAGAPEGALYVDGRLVGYIEGVTRL